MGEKPFRVSLAFVLRFKGVSSFLLVDVMIGSVQLLTLGGPPPPLSVLFFVRFSMGFFICESVCHSIGDKSEESFELSP